MDCERARTLIHEDADGGLVAAELRQLEAHLETCSACSAARERWLGQLERLRCLPTEMQPDRDLWGAIESRLAAADQPVPAVMRAVRSPLLLAAAVLVAIGGTALFWLRDIDGGPSRVPTALAVAQAADLAHVEDGVLGARRDLLAAFARQDGRLRPALQESIQHDIDALQQAIGDIRLALERRPNSRSLNMLLAEKYQQEAALLMRLSRI